MSDDADRAEAAAESAQESAQESAEESARSAAAIAEHIDDATDLVVDEDAPAPYVPAEPAPTPLLLRHSPFNDRLLRRARGRGRDLPDRAAAQHLLGPDPARHVDVPRDRAQPGRGVLHAPRHPARPVGAARARRGHRRAGAVRRRRGPRDQRPDRTDHPQRPGLARRPAGQPPGAEARRPVRRHRQGAGVHPERRLRAEGLRRRAGRRPAGALRADQQPHRASC